MTRTFKISIIILLHVLVWASCRERNDSPLPDGAYYTCSMDPQVVSDHPGICPICKMQLNMVSANVLKPGEMRLSDQQLRLGGIRFDTVQMHELGAELEFPGRLINDPSRNKRISSLVSGRIDHLYIKSEGDLIAAGQLLYEINSDELIKAEKDFLISMELNKEYQLQNTARKRLQLLGVNEKVIRQISDTRKILYDVPFFSDADGVVTELEIKEGEYINEGEKIFSISSNKDLWVEIHIAPKELEFVKEGNAKIELPGIHEGSFTATVDFVEPEIHFPSRYIQVRLKALNLMQGLHPGILVTVRITAPGADVISVSNEAILAGENESVVWVYRHDSVFEMRKVIPGMVSRNYTEIKQGLNGGEVVVTRGAYLIQSEYFFKRRNK
jgi:Cu(I)/Ag(I) efflux system membrane fusion protein